MSRAQSVLIWWLLLTACAASDETGPNGVVVRDSAGVRIIESGVPAWAEGEEWRIGPEPPVEFGRADGLHRIVAAFRLDDGRAVVAHASGPSHGPALQLDDDGNLWVVEYAMPGEVGNRRTVFDRNGVWLGTVVLPPRFSPLHIGADFVLGVWRDELDVEHVRLYELIKPAGRSSSGIHSGTRRVPARAGGGTGVANSRASGAVGPHVRRVEEISLGDDSTQWEIGCVGGASGFRGCSSSRL